MQSIILDETQKQPEHTQKKRITSNFMTKFEIARVLGARAQQIALGAPSTLSGGFQLTGQLDPIAIAREELRQFKIPMIIRRPLPNGDYEDWPIRDFQMNEDED